MTNLKNIKVLWETDNFLYVNEYDLNEDRTKYNLKSCWFQCNIFDFRFGKGDISIYHLKGSLDGIIPDTFYRRFIHL